MTPRSRPGPRREPGRPALSVDAPAVTALLEGLVRVPSINPALVPGGQGEAAVADVLRAACARLGMIVTVDEPAPGRPNVTARLPGADPGRGRSLVLNGHMDTVGVAGMEAPFAPARRGDRLYGRGAYDMKSGLAAMIGAVAAVRAAGLAPLGDVVLTFVADEEHLSLGTDAVVRGLRADGAIVTEPTGLRICVAHKGFVWAMIRTAGRAAHGSDYETGVDAIAHMGRVLGALERLDRRDLPGRTHPLLGRPSVHAGVVTGGEGESTYPPSCALSVERRTLPDETEADVRAEFEAILRDLGAEDARFRASLEVTGARPGLEVRRDAGVVRALHESAADVLGTTPEYMGASYWCDAAILSGAGIPSVVFGPSGEGAHAAVEYVDLPSVVACAGVLARTIVTFCGV